MDHSWTMEDRREYRRPGHQGRSGDFIGGIDNEALDFSQLEAFINSEGAVASGYFSESLNPAAATTTITTAATTTTSTIPASGKLLNVIVENKHQSGHPLPDSPPDSGSEHPYSPSSSCDQQPLQNPEIIYTNLTHGHLASYKNQVTDAATLLSHHPILTGNEGLLLSNGHIVVPTHLDAHGLTQDGLTTDGRHMIITSTTQTQEPVDGSPRHAAIPFVASSSSSSPSITSLVDNQLIPQIDQNIDVIYTNLQSVPKKRKLSQENVGSATTPLVKSEPEMLYGDQSTTMTTTTTTTMTTTTTTAAAAVGGSSPDEDYAVSENGACLSDSQYQCIRFQPFQQNAWHVLCDQNLTELPVPHYRVDADKGFNFSNADDAFVCQKKNHFQITCHVQLVGDAQFVKTSDGLQKIISYHLHFYGVKFDCPTQTIRVEQSQSDRSKKPFHPVLVSDSRVELVSSQVTKVTVGRLHFSETTSNNMRKKGKPNPEQRYFQLVVGLHAHTSHGHYPVASHASQRIIVRASNPGQFESDVELCWQKGQTQESIFHSGKVGINTDRPDESLVIHGNLKITGHIIQPSDLRAKKNIVECNTAEQLRNVQKLRVVRYEYAPGFASQLNLNTDLADTGVIAQEVAEIIPEAVSPTGDIILENGRTIDNFLVVNKERIFMENVGAVKELCKVTDNLETRIGQLERINRRLNKLKRDDSLKSNSTVNSKKHNSCQKQTELCSNKFIQIVIVILVLIMAFCLAAITTLYLMEAARHNQLTQNNIFAQRTEFNNRKIPSIKNQIKPRPSTPTTILNVHVNPHNKQQKINDVNHRPSIENTIPSSKVPMVIGKPSYCPDVDGDIDAGGPCQIYCCSTIPLDNPEVVESALYDKTQKPNLNQTATTTTTTTATKVAQVALIHNKISKPFHSNDIGKQQQRQRRDTDVFWTEQENTYLDNGEQFFTITIQGNTFNMTLTNDYCYDCTSNSFNISYAVPISKYMPDDVVTVAFRSNQPNYKEIEACQNDNNNNNNNKQQDCPFNAYWDETTKTQPQAHQNLEQHITNTNTNKIPPSNFFEVAVVNLHNKIFTYRASLIQNQHVCQLSPNKLGIEYIEYNLNFYRDCDEK